MQPIQMLLRQFFNFISVAGTWCNIHLFIAVRIDNYCFSKKKESKVMEREQVETETLNRMRVSVLILFCFIVCRRKVQMNFRSRNNNKNKRKKKSLRRRRSSSSVRKFYFHLINNKSRWWSRNKMQRNVAASIHRASAPNARNEIILVSHQRPSNFDSTSFFDGNHFGPTECQAERIKSWQWR